jgi:hypothetical protein
MIIQLNLCNLIFQLYDIRQKIMVPKVFLFTKIKLEYSNILYNLTHFHGDFDTFPWSLWHISLVPLTHFPGSFDTFPWSLWHISLVPLTHFPGPFDTFPWSLWHISLVPLTQFPGPFDTFPWSLCVSDRFHCLLLVTLFCNTQKICSNARHCWKISEKNTFWLAQDNSFVLTSIRGLFSSIVIEVIF